LRARSDRGSVLCEAPWQSQEISLVPITKMDRSCHEPPYRRGEG
jgi:hypothetical protein